MGSFHSRGGGFTSGGGIDGVGNQTPGVIRLIYEPNPTLEIRGKRLSPKAKNLENREKKQRTNGVKRQDKYIKGGGGGNNNNADGVNVGQMNRTTASAGQQKFSHNGATGKVSGALAQKRNSKTSKNSGDEEEEEENREEASESKVRLDRYGHLPPIDSPEAINISAVRMKALIKQVKIDEISKKDIVKNLEYVIKVLEKVYDSEKRRILEEETELNEVVETDSVSGIVKEWLTSTFTRSLSNMNKKTDEKVFKFRSVANAIRAGIVVDRIYRRMSSSAGLHVPPNVLLQMKNIDTWSFDVFQVNDIGEGHALKYVGYEILQKYDVINKFKINSLSLDNFLLKLEQGYSKYSNPYHNLVHAADVTQTMHSIFSESKLSLWLTDVEIFATIIASLIHDFEHTGTTNAFHINTGSDFAILYNDRAVLENHHASAAFKIMKDENHNIISNLTRDQYREFRALVIEIVISTDMSFHFQQIKNMKNLLSLSDPSIDKTKALSLIVHCADISHPAKEWNLHLQWTNRLIEEFFRQGDMESELGLPISPLCDRSTTNISESQIGFIDFIVDPSFQVMGDMLERISAPLRQQHQPKVKPEGPRKRRNSASSLSSSSSEEPDQKSDESLKMKQRWINYFANNKKQWRDKAIKAPEKEEPSLSASTTKQNTDEEKLAKATESEAERTESELNKQDDDEKKMTNTKTGDTTVTLINVKSAPETENGTTEAERADDKIEQKKTMQGDEDRYNNENGELTESELIVSSYSSLNDDDTIQ